jgi:hypothetical protein
MSETKKQAPRRKFLKGAAVGSAGAAALSFPMISQGQAAPQTLRFQSTWPAKDIFHEYALDFAKKVNDMTGGELRIEVLPAGAVVPAFQLLDAVSKGTLDGGMVWWFITTVKMLPSHYGDLVLHSVWMPICCSLGTNTAAVKKCLMSSTKWLALT